MLTALAPSGPVAQPVPTSPPSTTDSTQSARRESFQDVYRSVPANDESQSDAAPKQKTDTSPVATKSKKSNTGDANDKTDVTATPTPRQIVLQRIPLTFALPSLGQEIESQPVSDESASESEGRPDFSTQSSSTLANTPVVRDFSLAPPKPGQTVATALIPANENLAFSARLTQPEAQPAPGQATRTLTPPPTRPQSSNETRTTADPPLTPTGKDPNQIGDVKKAVAPEIVLPVHEG